MRVRPRGARRAMMPVRDVQRRHVLERRHDRGADFGLGPPDRVLDAVGGREIVERRGGRALRHRARERVAVAEREQHWPALRARLDNVARAVVFLVGPRLLVLLDQAAVVFVDRKAGGDAGLLVTAHAQPVEIHGRTRLLDERRLLQRLEVRDRARVDRIRVRIGVGRQVDFGAGDVQEAGGIAGQRAGFVRVDDVVGDGGDAGSQFGTRT